MEASGFHSLSALLPRRDRGSVSKAAIFKQASGYIRSLKQEKKSLQMENAEMTLTLTDVRRNGETDG